jgi:hypothetical protein
LCESCNSKTGSWYGSEYVTTAKQAMLLPYRSGGNLSLAYPYAMHPLRFLKQVVTCFSRRAVPVYRGRTRTSYDSS